MKLEDKQLIGTLQFIIEISNIIEETICKDCHDKLEIKIWEYWETRFYTPEDVIQ